MMNQNHAFEKSLALLSHPLSLAAIGLLLANDQVFRRLSPSWWTGKIGDLAWLFFVPFVGAAFISWLVPGKERRSRHEDWSFALSFALTGVGFVLIKTVPMINWVATRIFTALANTTPSLKLDPGDLLALPALALSAWLWYSTRDSHVSANRQRNADGTIIPLQRTTRGLIVLPVAVLVLLADAAAPDPGIICFSREGNQIYARGGYNSSFVSQDGGITWDVHQPGAPIDCETNSVMTEEWLEAPGPHPNTLYRYQPEHEIQLSTDGGKTWSTGMKFHPISEPERIYYLKSRPGSPLIDPGPFDAIADPATGNMLFAMGQQGVLVHTAQGQWLWSQGGAYRRPERFPSADAFTLLLGGMAFLALGTTLLIYSTLALRWTKHWLRIAILVLAWLAWLGVVVLFPPATTYSYSDAIAGMGLLALAVLAVPLAIEQTVRLIQRSPNDLPRLLVTALAGGLLFLAPYVFWFCNALPQFLWAMIFSLVLAAAVLAAGWLQLRNQPAKSAGNG